MSIRLRLALWYGGLTGLVLVLVSLATYALHTRAHYDDLDRAIVQGVEHVAEEYEASPSAAQHAELLRNPIAQARFPLTIAGFQPTPLFSIEIIMIALPLSGTGG